VDRRQPIAAEAARRHADDRVIQPIDDEMVAEHRRAAPISALPIRMTEHCDRAARRRRVILRTEEPPDRWPRAEDAEVIAGGGDSNGYTRLAPERSEREAQIVPRILDHSADDVHRARARSSVIDEPSRVTRYTVPPGPKPVIVLPTGTCTLSTSLPSRLITS